MHPILADALTWTQIGIFAALTSAAVAIAAYFSRGRVSVSPQPLEVRVSKELAEQFADKKTFELYHAENKGRLDKLDSRFRELDATLPKAMQRISQQWRDWADVKLKDLAEAHVKSSSDQWKEINEIKSKFDPISRSLGRIEGRIQNIQDSK
jgi:hypothetical protein